MPAESEEILRGPHPFPAQNLRPDRRQNLLERRARGDPPVRRIGFPNRRVRLGESPAVHLPLGVERQIRKGNER